MYSKLGQPGHGSGARSDYPGVESGERGSRDRLRVRRAIRPGHDRAGRSRAVRYV